MQKNKTTNDEEKIYTGYVYMIYNDVNDKVYIGETIQSIKKRFKLHLEVAFNPKSDCYNRHLPRAIRKYGKEHFFIKELEHISGTDKNKIKELILKLEHFYVSKYDSQNNGYNLTSGGNLHTRLSSEVKLHLSDYRKNNKEFINSAIENLKSATESKIVDIYMYDFDTGTLLGEYHGAYVIAKEFGIDSSSIIKICKGKMRFLRINPGKRKVTFKYKGEHYIPNYILECYTDDRELYDKFIIISEGAKKYNTDVSQITRCCKGQNLSAGKYNGKPIRWRYITNVEK